MYNKQCVPITCGTFTFTFDRFLSNCRQFPVDYWQMRVRHDHMVVGFTTTFAISADHH